MNPIPSKPLRHLFVMEDQNFHLKLLNQGFEKYRLLFKVSFVNNAQDALLAICKKPFYKVNPQTSQSTLVKEPSDYPVVILDNQVPPKTGESPAADQGTAIAREIRNLENLNRISKTILFSFSSDPDKQKFAKRLFDYVLPKNVNLQILVGFINNLPILDEETVPLPLLPKELQSKESSLEESLRDLKIREEEPQ